MIPASRLWCLALLTTGLLAAPVVRAISQDAPAVVVSIAGVDRLLADIGYLTRAAGTPEVGGLITLLAGPYLEGIDTKKPVGFVLGFNSTQPAVVGLVPVLNFQTVLKKIEEQGVRPEEVSPGLKKLHLQRDVFLREQAGWVFVSDNASHLTNVPRDPDRLLGGLGQQYGIVVQVNAGNVPTELKEKAVSRLREDFERNLQQHLARAPEANRVRLEQVRRHGFEQMVGAIRDADQLILGWGVDSRAGKTYLDFNITAAEGSRFAQQMVHKALPQSGFTGFRLPEAALTLHWALAVPQEHTEPLTSLLKELRPQLAEQIDRDQGLPSDAARATLKESVGLLTDVVEMTLAQGEFDGGAAIVLSPGAVQVVAGGRVADGSKVEQAIRKLVEAAGDRPQVPHIAFDAENYRTIDLHTLSVPIPDREREARRLLGDRLDVVLGTGPQSVHLAFGKDCVALLKKVIDASEAGPDQALPPVSLNVALTPILELAAAVDNKPAVSLLAQAIRNAAGKDRISVTAQAIERGVSYRLEVDEGVLRLIGQAARIQGTGNAGP